MHAGEIAAVLGRELADPLRHLGDHRLEHRAGDRVAAMPLGQRHHAERDRYPALDGGLGRPAPRRRAAPEPHQLGGAAADVEQDDALGVGVDQRRAAGRGEGGLGLAVDDLEVEPDLAQDAGVELVAVLGGAARLCRDQAGAAGAALVHLVATHAERRDGALDRRLADAAGGGNPLAEADDARERVDDAEPLAGRARHQQAAIVGAEVERRIGGARLAGIMRMPPIVTTTPPAAVGPRPIAWRVEAARGADLVFHSRTFPSRRSPFWSRQSRHVFRQIGTECNSVARRRNMSDQRKSVDGCACPCHRPRLSTRPYRRSDTTRT